MVFPSLQTSHRQFTTRFILNSPRPQRIVVSLSVPAWQQRSASSHDFKNGVSALRHGLLLHFPTLTLFLLVPSSKQPSGKVTKWSAGVELQVSTTGSETNGLFYIALSLKQLIRKSTKSILTANVEALFDRPNQFRKTDQRAVLKKQVSMTLKIKTLTKNC